MGTATSRDGLLDTLEAERRSWDALLAEIGEGRMEQPGVNGNWTFKDMTAHLNTYRRRTIDRMQAAGRGEQPPPPPWPPELDIRDEAQLDQINASIYETNKDRPLAAVLAESRAQFGQMREAVIALPDATLFTPGLFAWMEGAPLANTLNRSYAHLHEEHEPDIRAWLDRINNTGQ